MKDLFMGPYNALHKLQPRMVDIIFYLLYDSNCNLLQISLQEKPRTGRGIFWDKYILELARPRFFE